MSKLYKMENVYKREIMRRKNKNKKIFPKLKEKITIFAKNKSYKKLEKNIKKQENDKNVENQKKL